MSEDFFSGKDKHRLYYQRHLHRDARAVLIFIHGLNEHSGRYQGAINYFYEKSYTVYAYDHRGHGRSDGVRSYVNRFEDLCDDLKIFHQLVLKAEKNKKIFLIGHSMGGQVLLNYVAKTDLPMAGILTSSANIELAVKIPGIKKLLVKNLATLLPKTRTNNEIDPQWISRDVEVVRAYKRDPMIPKDITFRLAAELIHNQASIYDLPPKIHAPIFMMHGGADHICAPQGTEKFFAALPFPDRQMTIYDDFYHEIFNEFGKEEVFRDMHQWIKKH